MKGALKELSLQLSNLPLPENALRLASIVEYAQAYRYYCDWARNDKAGFAGSYWYYILRGLMDVSMCLVMVTSMRLVVVAVALRTLHSRRYTTECDMLRGVVQVTGFTP
jgi:hypothetical protein